MTKFLELLTPLIEKLTWAKVAMLACVVAIGLIGTVLWENREIVYSSVPPRVSASPGLTTISEHSKGAIAAFMKQHEEVAMATVLSLDLVRNVRTPVYRAFNNPNVRRVVSGEITTGNDGTLPIFIRDAVESNNQMISLIQGEYSCSPVSQGGIVKVYPSLKNTIKLSCRVPIPPAFGGGGAKGYIAVHLDRDLETFELERLKIDVMTLAMFIFNTEITGEKNTRMIP